MTLIDALKRADKILEIKPLEERNRSSKPSDHGIELKNVTYRYKDALRDAVSDVSISIKPGEHVALLCGTALPGARWQTS